MEQHHFKAHSTENEEVLGTHGQQRDQEGFPMLPCLELTKV